MEDLAEKATGSQADHLNLVANASYAFKWITEDKPASEVAKALKEAEALGAKIKSGEFKDRCVAIQQSMVI